MRPCSKRLRAFTSNPIMFAEKRVRGLAANPPQVFHVFKAYRQSDKVIADSKLLSFHGIYPTVGGAGRVAGEAFIAS